MKACSGRVTTRPGPSWLVRGAGQRRRQLRWFDAVAISWVSSASLAAGHPMPDGNVWLVQREAERDALARLLAAMQASPGRAIQGAGSPSSPVPVSIDLDRHPVHVDQQRGIRRDLQAERRGPAGQVRQVVGEQPLQVRADMNTPGTHHCRPGQNLMLHVMVSGWGMDVFQYEGPVQGPFVVTIRGFIIRTSPREHE